MPKGHLFVMGDNRALRRLDRAHVQADETDCVPGDEFVDGDLVVGKVFALLWPCDRADWIHRPTPSRTSPTRT